MDRGITNAPAVIAERAKIVWLSLKGASARTVSQQTGASLSTVYRWIRRWQEEGSVRTRPFHKVKRKASWCVGPNKQTDFMDKWWSQQLVLVAVLVVKGTSTGMAETQQLLGVLVGQVVDKHIPPGCHLVLMTHTLHSPIVPEIISLLERNGLWKLADTRVVVVGGTTTHPRAVLLHPSLRNTIHAVHLTLFLDQSSNFMGHRLRVVSVPFFPYMAYKKESDHPGGPITPTDSIDKRLLSTIAGKLNVSFDNFEEPKRGFGLAKDGKFNGLVGFLQREEADFCTMLGATADRLRVLDYIRTYPSDLMTIISLNPPPFPQHSALIRPFEKEVWASLLVGVVVWGIVFWVMQQFWVSVTARQRSIQFSKTLLYGWGALLEQPPLDPSVSLSGQMLAGWWLLFSLIIITGYKSSLIAHLTVQSKTQPMETLEDLVHTDGWRWGTEPWVFTGIPGDYYAKHTDPVVKEIHRRMEVYDVDAGLKEVLKGGFSLIDSENYIGIIIASRYTTGNGYTPFFISKKGFPMTSAFGWGFRKGAPNYELFRQLIHGLEDTGIIKYWMEDVIDHKIRNTRATGEMPAIPDLTNTEMDNKQIALSLNHLQGAFYLLFLGSGLALLVLVSENFINI
ncbi:hypothetical protein Pcinc_009585 [Petrolisthes cinctipes]|uniref:Ionotropic glutamate receptor C-terminal domain-containing protein n=1 Tax=Petrolisthes cinctipes TaxID=88211 RepID=A0AAE1KWB0_PETCI|nr:hypothetical protein Pcinc_009585 [Petrolisthes cinctipes]